MGNIGVPGVHDGGAIVIKEHSQDNDHQSLTNSSRVANRLESENDSVILEAASSVIQPLKRRSPRSLLLSDNDLLPDERAHEAANKKKYMDPDYVPLLERASSGGVSAMKKVSPNSKRKSLDRDLKAPCLCLSPAVPYTCKFPKSQPNCIMVQSNQLHTSISEVQIADRIQSKTQQHVTAQVQPKTRSHSTVSSPVHSSDSSPIIRHKYPTRHKTTGLC